jgi:hypothetical protein
VKGRLPLKTGERNKPRIAQMTQMGGEAVSFLARTFLFRVLSSAFTPVTPFEIICEICGICGLEFEI